MDYSAAWIQMKRVNEVEIIWRNYLNCNTERHREIKCDGGYNQSVEYTSARNSKGIQRMKKFSKWCFWIFQYGWKIRISGQGPFQRVTSSSTETIKLNKQINWLKSPWSNNIALNATSPEENHLILDSAHTMIRPWMTGL